MAITPVRGLWRGVKGFVTKLNVRCGRKEKDKVHAKVCGLSN